MKEAKRKGGRHSGYGYGSTKCPPITREEIVNACGVEDIHYGTNYSRIACVIAVAKARDTFEPFLHQVLHNIKADERGLDLGRLKQEVYQL